MSYTTHCPLCAEQGRGFQVPARYQVSGWRVCSNHIKDVGVPQLVLNYPITDDEARSIKERFKEAIYR